MLLRLDGGGIRVSVQRGVVRGRQVYSLRYLLSGDLSTKRVDWHLTLVPSYHLLTFLFHECRVRVALSNHYVVLDAFQLSQLLLLHDRLCDRRDPLSHTFLIVNDPCEAAH
jgi:hypothetical protein